MDFGKIADAIIAKVRASIWGAGVDRSAIIAHLQSAYDQGRADERKSPPVPGTIEKLADGSWLCR